MGRRREFNFQTIVRIFRYVFFCLSFLMILTGDGMTQSNWVRFTDEPITSTLPTIDLVNATGNEIIIKFDIPGMNYHEVEINNERFRRLVIPNGGHTAEVGNPELPTIGKFVEIPYGVTPKIDVISYKSKTFENYNVYPAQEPLPDYCNSGPVDFKRNRETYSKDSFYPNEIVILDKPKYLRGHRIVLIIVYPVHYNPVSKRLRVYSEITVRVEFEGARSPSMGEVKNDKFSRSILSRLVLNYKSSDFQDNKNNGLPKPADSPSDGADMLIIAHDDFYDDVLPLASWRARKGYKTKIVRKSDIENAGYSWTADNTWDRSYTGIDGYIKNAYDNWNPSPSFVLLVGDADKLPTHYVNDHPSGCEQYKKVGTDLYYGTMDDANDLSYVPFPDIYVGRLPSRNSNDVKTIVNKIISYEINLYGNATSWFKNLLFAAYDQPGRYFISTSEDISTFLEDNGYICKKVYTGGSYSGTTQDIIDIVNSGCFFINYRDHGDSRNGPNNSGIEGWQHPLFQTFDVSSLTNGSKLPIMFSICCRTGWFDGETDQDNTDPNPIPDCLGEAWLKESGGGVGFIGSTRISYSGYNDELDKGFYDAIWDNFDSGYSGSYINSPTYHLGPILDYGKFWMYDKYVLTGGSGYPRDYPLATEITRTEFEEFLILGDPALEVWTDVPSQFTNVSITDNGNSITVNAGVNGATICVSSGDNGTGYHLVAENVSQYTFTTSVRPLYITITKHNYIPYTAVTGGTFTSDEYWFGNMHVLGDVVVGNGKTLTILPYATVNLNGHVVKSTGGTIIVEFGADINPDIRLVCGSSAAFRGM
ncbi:MAG: hypothetical protein H0Z28_13495 [Archaeoglobus sp.]|nr:hypothetical protein [Archaeoglobus sp.]